MESLYLIELAKSCDIGAIYNQALEHLSKINEFTFDGFADGLQGSNNLVEVTTYNEDNYSGKIVSYSDDIIALDEYSTDTNRRLKRTYFNRETIARISVGVPWIKTIARSLVEKNA